jgi:hypothetical protein
VYVIDSTNTFHYGLPLIIWLSYDSNKFKILETIFVLFTFYNPPINALCKSSNVPKTFGAEQDYDNVVIKHPHPLREENALSP